MAQNMYRVGDYVYFESYPSEPYLIRRIEELTKNTVNSTVEARVMCFYRRRDLPTALLKVADKACRQNRIVSGTKRSLLTGGIEAGGPSTSIVGNTSVDDDDEPTERPESKENGVVGVEQPAEPASKALDGDNSQGDADKPSSSATKEEMPETAEGQQEPNAKREEEKEGEGKGAEEGEKNNKPQQETKEQKKLERSYGLAGLPIGAQDLSPEQVHMLRQRELFLSRQVETMPATQIRGKCAVVMLSEVETCEMYLGREDAFFYSLVYDSANQTLLADKGMIEVGERCQATIPELLPTAVREQGAEEKGADEQMEVEEPNGEPAAKKSRSAAAESGGVEVTDREAVVYHPHHGLTDRDIDQFLIIARAVGTFSRALDSSASMKLPSLHLTAAAASRDVTLLHAMALLHQAGYDVGQATKFLVPPPCKQHYPLEADKLTSNNTVSLGGPILCRDQLEEWSASEATLFEDALEKYQKDFHGIRVDCLPWKSLRDIVEYYYMWKTTARYADMQKLKKEEQENKLKQIYIPSYNKANPSLIGGALNTTQELVESPVACESCKASESTNWFTWGPTHLQLRLCNDCWVAWKKRGGLKIAHEFDTYDLDGAADVSANQPSAGVGRQPGSQQRYPPQPRGGTTIRGGGGGANGTPQSATGYSKFPLNQSIPRPGFPHHHQQQQQLYQPKGRSAFYMCTALQARVARRMAPKVVLNLRKAARTPFKPVNGKLVDTFYYNCELTDVLRAARQVKRGQLSKSVIDYLTKLHSKPNPAGINGPALLASAANLAASGIRR